MKTGDSLTIALPGHLPPVESLLGTLSFFEWLAILFQHKFIYSLTLNYFLDPILKGFSHGEVDVVADQGLDDRGSLRDHNEGAILELNIELLMFFCHLNTQEAPNILQPYNLSLHLILAANQQMTGPDRQQHRGRRLLAAVPLGLPVQGHVEYVAGEHCEVADYF